MEKSHVALADRVCIICGARYESGELLLHKQLKPVLENHTIAGMGICPECQKRLDDGYIAIVGVIEEKTEDMDNPAMWYRTGDIIFLKKDVAKEVIKNIDLDKYPILPAEEGVVEFFKNIKEETQNDRQTEEGD